METGRLRSQSTGEAASKFFSEGTGPERCAVKKVRSENVSHADVTALSHRERVVDEDRVTLADAGDTESPSLVAFSIHYAMWQKLRRGARRSRYRLRK